MTAAKSSYHEIMEPAILVLGAISDPDGAYEVIVPHLGNLVPYLFEAVNSNNEIMRSTTLWTLSKYSEWISKNDKLVEEYITVICKKMIDSDQNV